MTGNPRVIEQIQFRIHGDARLPTLIYLPGLHGDWTLLRCFRPALEGRARLVEFTYPRTIDWSLEDYAHAVEETLLANGVSKGWLIGESFSSQVAWQMAGRFLERRSLAATGEANSFDLQGIILAGGFVRHPISLEVWLGRLANQCIPHWALRTVLALFRTYARVRFHANPEARASIDDFIQRRTSLDRRAILQRFRLLEQSNPEDVARRFDRPVYYLTAFSDLTVPWPRVHGWLKKNCPGYRGMKICRWASHNVLCSAAQVCAEQIMTWLAAEEEIRAQRETTLKR